MLKKIYETMSRFGLRSNAENLKISEDDKLNRKKKFCKTVTVPIKRIQTTTTRSYISELSTSLAYKEKNKKKYVMKNDRKCDFVAEITELGGAVRIELEKSENIRKCNVIAKTTKTTELINKCDNEDGDNNNATENVSINTMEVAVAATTTISSVTSDRTLVCRLPLIRLTDILQKLKLGKIRKETNNLDHLLGDDNLDGDDKEEQLVEEQTKKSNSDEGAIKFSSKQVMAAISTTLVDTRTTTVKILCLYCDKKFSSHKMQLRHVDKFHCQQQDRRCSGRKPPATQMSGRKRKTILQHATGSQSFPGCSFCFKTTKGGASANNSLNPLPGTSDLNALFLHLIDCHADKYFGCKTCSIRFQNVTKMYKHMQLVHKRLPFTYDETSSSKSKDNDTESLISSEKTIVTTTNDSKGILKRNQHQQQQQQQRSQSVKLGGTVNCTAVTSAACNIISTSIHSSGGSGISIIGKGGVNSSYCLSPLCGIGSSQCTTAVSPDTVVIGAEEPILSRLGLTQNRLPNNRKGIRLRRENLLPEALLKSEQNSCANFASSSSTSSLASLSSSGSTNSLVSSSIMSVNPCSTICSPKIRGSKTIKCSSDVTSPDIIFRVPTRNDVLSCVFDDNFYKEVVANVRNNLLLYLDGKIPSNVTPSTNVMLTRISGNTIDTSMESSISATLGNATQPPQIHSTLVKSPIVLATMDHSEIHAASTLSAITAFPTLLTAEQYGGDAISSKLRRPHTKNSWKWKWDNVKKFKIVNEGGKLIKKMKHPMLGLRDLSKLDMWTQLTMRQKHEYQQQRLQQQQQIPDDINREVKQRLNEQLNWILDMRLLPHIILEQNEQAIIKAEKDKFAISESGTHLLADDLCERTCSRSIMRPSFADENFLSMLNLLPNPDNQSTHQRLVLSGEWARPRCYLCMCCGSKFEKLKSLEEHKMFRHSHILSNHYEVVGRELLAGNLLRHLFIPKKALSRYGNDLVTQKSYSSVSFSAPRRLFWQQRSERDLHAVNNEESSDCSLQSVLNSCAAINCSPPVSKVLSCAEECDPEIKINTSVTNTVTGNSDLDLIHDPQIVVSPTHSMQSCSSSIASSSSGGSNSSSNSKQEGGIDACIRSTINCSKCKRQCNGFKDLYRHMLDCSGDYIWTMAKKRKYRYYCGSKKRRPCNKHHVVELNKNKPKVVKISSSNTIATTTISNTPSMNAHDDSIGRTNTPIYSIKIKTPARPRPSDAESIKKMLENLPPKRVCKKVCPLLAKKVVKSGSQLKPKLIIKHKIYSRLRKTRMRQLTRFLTKVRKTKLSRQQQPKNQNQLQQQHQRPRKKNLTAMDAPVVQQLLKCPVKQHLSHAVKQSLNNKTNSNKRIINDKTMKITQALNTTTMKEKCENIFYDQDECDGGSSISPFPTAINKFLKNDGNEIIIESNDGAKKEVENSLRESCKKSLEKSKKNVETISPKKTADCKRVMNVQMVGKDFALFPREEKQSTNVIDSIDSENVARLPINIAINSNTPTIITPKTMVPTSEVRVDRPRASRISVAPLSSLMPSSSLMNKNNNTVQMKSFSNNNNKNDSSTNNNITATNKNNNKRTKRINDCIAMLTGKLAQKIKSEENKSYNQLNSNNNDSNRCKNNIDSTPAMQITPFNTNIKGTTTWKTTMSNVTPIQTVIMSTPEVTITKVVLQQQHSSPPDYTIKTPIPPLASPLKRMPKRKTISRRIIKAPKLFDVTDTIPTDMDCTVTKTTYAAARPLIAPITAENLHNTSTNPLTKLPYTTIKNVPVTSTLVTMCETLITPVQTLIPLSTCSNVSYFTNTINSTTNLIPNNVKPFVTASTSSIKQVMVNQVKSSFNATSNIATVASDAVTASIPTLSLANVLPSNIIPVCTLNMPPKGPVYIPVAATTHAYMNNISLPVPLTMENITNQMPALSTTASNKNNITSEATMPPPGVASVLPLITDVVGAMRERPHICTPCNVTATNFNTEPLNLSNTSRNQLTTSTNNSEDLSNTSNRSLSNGFVPNRRQTICGFEARNFVLYDEMEPLDLSKNSRQAFQGSDNSCTVSTNNLVTIAQPLMSLQKVPSTATAGTTVSQSTLPPQTVLVHKISQSLTQQQQQQSTLHKQLVVPNCESNSVLTISGLTPEVLNKQFYSNLDLLRIPQIRNPVASSICTSPTFTTNSPPKDLVGINTVIVITTASPTTTATISTSTINTNHNIISSSPSVLLPHTTSKVTIPYSNLIVSTPKTSNKKRYIKSSSNNQNNINTNNGIIVANSASIDEIVNTVAISTSPYTSSKGKDIISKAKDNSKNKVILKMDEKVINHIDDAINSVINAVKASLRDSEEAERLKQEDQKSPQHQKKSLDFTVQLSQYSHTTAQQQNASTLSVSRNTSEGTLSIPTDTKKPTATVPIREVVQEKTYITPNKRNMRSKTLDCRPSTLTTKSFDNSNTQCFDKTKPTIKYTDLRDIEKVEIGDRLVAPTIITSAHKNKQFITEVCASDLLSSTDIESDAKKALWPPNKKNRSIISTTNTKQLTEGVSSEMIVEQNGQSEDGEQQLMLKITADFKERTVAPTTLIEQEVRNESIKENPKAQKMVEGGALANTTTVTSTTTATNNVSLQMDQMNNVNNTLPGFHESDQIVTVASSITTTTPFIDENEEGPRTDTTPKAKKQRKRRKNELAAIVADQLLESFKIDKVRRDNLKKLENLAYEKSEDLLLTGMLLMSSTKRIVTTVGGGVGSGASSTTIDSIENSSNSVVNKRNKSTRSMNCNVETIIAPRIAKASPIIKVNSAALNEETVSKKDQSSAHRIEGSAVKESVKQSETCVATTSFSKDQSIKSKRRVSRSGRRGKILDNVNISKLKSSLESFSIDIERQLMEFESKNVNVFKNVTTGCAELNNQNKTNIANSCLPSKSSVILRPSILSVTLDAANQNNNSSQQASKVISADTNSKSTVSSRDPRLNKNIHKEKGDLSRKSPKSKICKTLEELDEIGDVDEDNYLTEITKNVNEKIMSNEIEEFAFKNDGFEMVHNLQDDSNSKFSRPPTSMSVRSAPNFHEDRSNLDSICDENTNTNTEALGMDLDDEISVYTSYSQDLGRNRGGRRRRRRRSILLSRKPKKRPSSRNQTNDKIECILCKKTFYSANSLAKHNMTLAHVSKVSEQEYLLSKKIGNITAAAVMSNEASRHGNLGPYAKCTLRRATISEPFCHITTSSTSSNLNNEKPSTDIHNNKLPILNLQFTSTEDPSTVKQLLPPQVMINDTAESLASKVEDRQKVIAESLNKSSPMSFCDVNNSSHNVAVFGNNSRLNLNPDERLFFECCNILKGTETPRLNSHEAENSHELSYAYMSYNQVKVSNSATVNNCIASNIMIGQHQREYLTKKLPLTYVSSSKTNLKPSIANQTNESTSTFKDPINLAAVPCETSYNKDGGRIIRSPTYSGNTTTSRFKTKAAMKGYENVNVDLSLQQQESKSHTICKLTELAEIALGNEDKQVIGCRELFSPMQGDNDKSHNNDNIVPVNNIMQIPALQQQSLCTNILVAPLNNGNVSVLAEQQLSITPECATLSEVQDHSKNCLPPTTCLQLRNDRNKNETRSSTSSKTIMHSSIIKAAVEEHQKMTSSMNNNKIVIPDRPFKNIGLEEKESITFQKPKTPAVNLLTDDNSVSTASFSDRDDYDFNSLSCDDEFSLHDGKHLKNSSSDSSTESSRATAKTFENKSLIMGRIFKNASTKTLNAKNIVTAVKVKSVGVQKDQTPIPKADLNQLFDELRGGGNSKPTVHYANHDNITAPITSVNQMDPSNLVPTMKCMIGNSKRKDTINTSHKEQENTPHASSPPAVVSSTTSTPAIGTRKSRDTRKKLNANITTRKSRKDISKLQSELGMSSDEIKKLIDEGQRKSKRRCASNHPKKLVEIWSSDEYEEFLSTKDIIALIEEKEQQEKRRKRKSSVNLCSSASIEKDKGKELLSDVTSSTKDKRRRNSRNSVSDRGVSGKHQVFGDRDDEEFGKNDRVTKYSKEKIIRKCTATTTTMPAKEEEPVSTTALDQVIVSANANSTTTLKKSNKPPNSYSRPNKRKNKASTARTTRGNGKKTIGKIPIRNKTNKKNKAYKLPKINEKSILATDIDEGDGSDNNENYVDESEDYPVAELRRNNRPRLTKTGIVRKKAVGEKPYKTQSISAEGVCDSVVKGHCKRSNGKSKSNNRFSMSMRHNNKLQMQEQSQQQQRQREQVINPKNKRKLQMNQSSPRRKRMASEKLYYWSSSSDDDFGLINQQENHKIRVTSAITTSTATVAITVTSSDNFDCGNNGIGSSDGKGLSGSGGCGSGSNNGEQYQKHGWIVGDSHKKLVTLLAIAKGNNKKVDLNSGVKSRATKKRN